MGHLWDKYGLSVPPNQHPTDRKLSIEAHALVVLWLEGHPEDARRFIEWKAGSGGLGYFDILEKAIEATQL